MIRLRKSLVLLRILFCFCIFTPINIFAEIEKFESKYHLQAILENPTYSSVSQTLKTIKKWLIITLM